MGPRMLVMLTMLVMPTESMRIPLVGHRLHVKQAACCP